MPVGTLVRWTDDRGFGFIEPDDGSSDTIFVHIKDLRKSGVADPIEGDVFEFAVASFNGRPVASALYRIHRAAGGP